jgi:hypothetical protein
MVAIIDYEDEAGGARYIEFKVCRSPTDPERVSASWCFAHNGIAIDQSRPGTSVATEFRCAVDCADQHGIPFVWVNDPEGLFPPWARP